MPHAEHTITVKRPVGDVFSYLADGTHNREWRSGVLEIECVRFALDLKPAGVMKLMTPMISRQMQREVAQLDALKRILER